MDPFERVTRLAASVLKTPVAALLLREEGSMCCASAIGLDNAQHAETTSLFAHVIDSGDALTVENVAADPRFQHDPLVASSPHLRFCASVPLIGRDGQLIGALSIADTEPRPMLSDADMATLRAFADLAADLSERQRRTTSRRDDGSTILAALSHDLRTPMNGVLGMAELLLTADDLSDGHRRRIENIKRSGTTLLSLLDQILDFAKLDTEHAGRDATSFDLRELLDQTAFDDVGKGLQRDIVDRLGTHHRFHGDVPWVKKLLSCFLNNVARFATEGRIRVIVTEETVTTDKVRIRLKAENASIDVQTIEHLLTSISRPADQNVEHFDETGLGLALCRKFAMTMDGTIGVDHSSGTPPCFWLDVSLLPDPEAIATSPTFEDSPASDSGESPSTTANAARHILVAEDNPDMAMLIEDLLDEAGYHATIAHDGASTLKVLGEQHFDVVLMDGRMPDMSGFETTAFIRQLPDERADIPIIALTGEALTGDRERYLAAGMNDYIAKPVDYERLIDTIERCCS